MTDRSVSSLRVKTLALAVCFLLSAICPGFSTAQVVPPPAAPPESAPIGSSAQDNAATPSVGSPGLDNATAPLIGSPGLDNVTLPPTGGPGQDNAAAPPAPVPFGVPAPETAVEVGVLERTHLRLERGIFERVIRIDNFFGTARTGDLRPPDFLLRWRNSLRLEEGGHVKYRTTVHGTMILPKISKRLRLVISGESEADPVTTTLPEDPGQPGFDRTLQNTRLVNTELRYTMIQKPAVNLFVGAGVRVKIPFESFVRTRFQFNFRLGEDTLARFGETLFWKSTDGLGETTEIALDRQLGRTTILRWANAGTVTQESQGLEWGTELSLLKELSPRSGITLSGGLSGVTDPTTRVETYRILARYRRNFLRPWLFYELEPEISWPRDAAGSYTSAYAFTFRFEIVFQGTGAMTKTKEPMAR